jgi:hypothetical protein
VAVGLAGIDDFDDEVGAVEFAFGALDADALDVVGGLAQAGGIDEAERDAMHLDDFLDGVACGASGGTDDGTLEAEEGIEQAAFADVRRTGDDGAGTVAQDAALLRGGDEFLRTFEHGVDALHQSAPVSGEMSSSGSR